MTLWLGPLLPRRGRQHKPVADGWPAWWAIGGWIAALLLSGLGAMVAVTAGATATGRVSLLAGQLGLWAAMIGTAVAASRTFGTGSLRRDFGMTLNLSDRGRSVLIGVGTQLFAVPAVYLPLLLLGMDLDVSGPAQSLLDDAPLLEMIVIAAGLIVIAPAAEELLFRGVLLRGLTRHIGRLAAIWTSAALFAAVHFQLVQFPALLAVGLVLGWLADRTNGLGAPMWAHAGFNATTVALLW